jgi:hypothetical protein
MLSVIKLSVIMLRPIMPRVIMLNVIKMSVISIKLGTAARTLAKTTGKGLHRLIDRWLA